MGSAVAPAFVIGIAGMVAGALARRLVGRLRRGARLRAPVCEVATGVLWAITGCLWGAGALPWRWLPALLGLAWLGVAASLVDFHHSRLPDALTLPAAGVAPLLLLPLGAGVVGRGLLGACVAVVGYGVVHLALPTALGLGDVKLAASLGAVLGAASWGALAVAAALAAVCTAIVAMVGACVVGLTRRAAVPHGPSMLAASWLVTAVAAVGATRAPPCPALCDLPCAIYPVRGST
jgi:leader peptidase (prepilin peptidase)/N-methyltransferase